MSRSRNFVAAPAILLALASVASAECRGSASYKVWFDATWSADSHPVSFPDNPHFSGLVGGTHNDAISFWAIGDLATQGIESMAELGQKGDLIAEVEQAIVNGTAETVIDGPGLPLSPGIRHVDIEVTKDFPLVTLVTMVAPSPDWFVGVSGQTLCVGDEWIDRLDIDLYPYDAGTDSGPSYSSPNNNTNPADQTAAIAGLPLGNGTRLGRFLFRLTAEAIFADGFESGDTSKW